ncbi:N-acetylglucosamine kinase [Cohnella lupini]|uniref:N-acetylglucosamine kinase-like BadF-type ATPase n=1 Tax=Cohnella lupini TaxID=1294267 RepID=A0A3D9I8G2_9BACL|nr:BadF/BadG/BcrA/BcrD ATPase family protein [Cohnella lupini]RED58043.1 N-acetylglucosamine kinase-like BadF-type ATPase [Cohnella lupini]
MKYYLGVDGGGSKTYTLIIDESGTIVGKGSSGNGNHQVGYDRAKTNIRESVEMALAQAGLTREEIEFAYFGLAGADREIDYRILRPMIAEMGFPRHDINCDTMIALRAGTDRPYGVVLICGTGTNSAGVNPEGRFHQCGGFSYTYGDYGGGGSLCVEAFRAVIRAWDGRESPTLLTQLVLDDLGYASVQEMYDDYLDHNKVPPLRLTKLLFLAAGQGDEVAKGILRSQGVELGKSARAVIRTLGMGNMGFDVVLAGSVIARGEGDFVTAYIEEAVKQAAPGANIVKLQVEPVVGAVWLAVESTGIPLPETIFNKLRAVSDYSLV